MKLLGARQLSVLLAGTLLLCHGVFGALHVICYSPLCVDGSEHTAEHQSAAGAVDDTVVVATQVGETGDVGGAEVAGPPGDVVGLAVA